MIKEFKIFNFRRRATTLVCRYCATPGAFIFFIQSICTAVLMQWMEIVVTRFRRNIDTYRFVARTKTVGLENYHPG
jgi:hypothetical protein